MFDHQSPSQTSQQVSKLIKSSIEKVTKQIENSGTQINFYEQKGEEDKVQSDSSVQDAKIFTKREQKIDVSSSYSKASQIQDSQINSSKFTINIQEKMSQRELSEKARDFISKIRSRKKQIEGSFVLKKIAETKRKKQEQKKKQVEVMVEKQIQKQIRKLKAQKNIQYFRQKQKLYQKNSNSLSPPRQRAQSKAFTGQSRNSVLPSIYSRDLQQIQQEPTRRINPTQKKVLKTKRRSYTVTDIRDDQSQNSQSTQIKLFDKSQKSSKMDRYSSFRSNLDLRSNSKRRYEDDDDKKCYLMGRNNTEDISEYLQKYSNFKEIRSSNINFSERNRREKIANKRKLTKSNLYLNDYQNQIQQQDG